MLCGGQESLFVWMACDGNHLDLDNMSNSGCDKVAMDQC
jgi:hypothetical protein